MAKIELTGGKAIAALLIIAAIVGGKFVLERSTLTTEAAEELKLYLRGEYASRMLHDFDTEGATDEELEAKGAELLKLEDIQFTKMSARGRGEDVRVRLEIQVGGADPPDGKRVRYYLMSHSTLTGWRVRWEISALSYYLKFSF
jgi:hypothetical protein